jgi:putative oxidoreductase
VMLIVGFQARTAAAVLALYCIATAVFFHTDFTNPDNIIHFMKNLAMTGGLLQIVGFGAGALSIDNRR